jgi:hypothetical protein
MLCDKVLILTEGFAVALRRCLCWGEPTASCLSPVTALFLSKIVKCSRVLWL